MRMMQRYMILLVLSFSFYASADPLIDLHKKISIERAADGKLKRVYLRETHSLNQPQILKNYFQDLILAQAAIKNKSLSQFLDIEQDMSTWPAEHQKIAKESLKYLTENDLKPIIESAPFQEALDHLLTSSQSEEYDFRVLAVPHDPTFFGSNELVMKILMQSLSIIRLGMGNSMGVDVAIFLIKTTFDLIMERRVYFQNYFLYNLDKYGAETFNISFEEAKKIQSSIFESRISWWNYWEKKYAKFDWDNYGQDRFVDQLIVADNGISSGLPENSSWGERLGFAFSTVQTGNSTKVLNLIDSRHVFSKKVSLAYDYTSPYKIRMTRLFYFLLQTAVRFAPVPAVSTVFDFFMDSMYVPQRQTEGALYGYFSDQGLEKEKDMVSWQSINPFVIMED